jgi:hypothetical protein
LDIFAGKVIIHRYPFRPARSARPIPVFPEVGSMMTEYPGIRSPERSAWVIIRRAMRSLMDPPAEKNSTLATTVILTHYSSSVRSESSLSKGDRIYHFTDEYCI